mmetsp:Transcript_37201/g.116463  ORF Transcript_37201/g.116463 Transcript_37201/m.116463 type:complete len:379 (-) Transcript_37201:37-1173(-)
MEEGGTVEQAARAAAAKEVRGTEAAGVVEVAALATAAAAAAEAAEAANEEVGRVWWGSEAVELSERIPLAVSAAHYSKQGAHKAHANEDRYAVRYDLNEDLSRASRRSERMRDEASAPASRGSSPAPSSPIPPSNAFFAVYDGHGGSDCSSLAATRLHLLLAHDEEAWRERPAAALAKAFAAAEQEMRAAYTRTSDRSGTCALAVLLRGSRLHVASVGDCRALLVSGEHTYQQLTTDQRASEPAERARILECGGEISADGRVWGSLIPSRTLGDFPWKDRDGGRALSSLPACASFSVLPTHKYLVLGSDGLFDVLQNRTIARLIGRLNSGAQRACNELVKEIKKRPGTDDTTVIVIHFERDRQRECSADKPVRRSVTV